MEEYQESQNSEVEEVEIDLKDIDISRRSDLHRKNDDRSQTAPAGKSTAAITVKHYTESSKNASSYKEKSSAGIGLPSPKGLGDTASKLMASSKSYSLTKSIKNHKETVDIRGPISSEIFFSVKTTPVEEDYIVKQLLGEGSFGQVKLVVHKRNQIERAMKIIRKIGVSNEEKEQMLKEVSILKSLDHPNIIKIFDMYEDETNMYLIIEYCAGGELFDRVHKETFSEAEAAKYIKQLLSAISYLHARNIVHRDLKAENLLFENDSSDANLKLIDFGVSCEFLKAGAKMRETLGTPYYIAPEVLLQNYDEKCDVWSCGVILYIILCGYPPFNGDDDNEILDGVKKGEFSFYGSFIFDNRGRLGAHL